MSGCRKMSPSAHQRNRQINDGNGTRFATQGWLICESAKSVVRPLVGRRILTSSQFSRIIESSDPQGVGLQFA